MKALFANYRIELVWLAALAVLAAGVGDSTVNANANCWFDFHVVWCYNDFVFDCLCD